MISFRLKYLIIALICLPVFFINIKTSHDWGDDFATYIHQAKNITRGIPQKQTGYIYNPEFLHLGPPTQPVGFPLLLAPVYAIFGNSIKHFDLYISLFLFAFALLTFYFLNRYYSVLISILLVMVFVYNPYTLNFKMEIMSDIPFSLLLLCCVCMYRTIRPSVLGESILLALCTGFLIAIRNIGMVFAFTLVLDGLFNLYFNRHQVRLKQFDYKNALYPILIGVAGLAVYILLNKVIFDAAGEGIFAYSYLFDLDQLWYFIRLNLYNYMFELRSFFERWDAEWKFVSLFSGTMTFAFIALGMIKKMSEKFDFIDGLTLIYLAVIIVYPFPHAGFRLLFPLLPYFLYYTVQGIMSINIRLKLTPNVLAIMMTAAIIFSYKKGISEIFKQENKILQGPQESASRQAFDYINKNTPPNARFNFIRAHAFALYAEPRSCMSHRPNQTSGEIDQSISKYGVDYILVNNEISDDSIRTYVKIYEMNWSQIWSNDKYSLYRRNQK
jgi:hypothetical protein